MNRKILFLQLVLFVSGAGLFAQGTAFNYQGRLNTNGGAATGLFDFRFALYDALTNGNAVSVTQINPAVPVSAGLFNADLDFGKVFTGSNYWLSIGVRTNGDTNSFTLLFPRQPLLPVPYAIFAATASNLLGTIAATQLVGSLASAQLAGNYSGSVNFTNATNSFTGKFFGNGGGLTNLNASMLATGTVADARLSTNVALLNSNQTFIGINNFTNVNNVFSGSFTGAFSGNGFNLTNLAGSNIISGTVADARLSTNVALLNRSQAFTGTNIFNGPVTFNGSNTFTSANVFSGSNIFNGPGTFNGVNIFTNGGNSFAGNFFGNGLVGWVAVNGIAQQAVRDTGYLLLHAGLTTVTLPLSAQLFAGDIVRVSGAGGGGWLVAENSGQSVLGNLACYRNAYPMVGPDLKYYYDVAGSADGIRLYAVGNFQGVMASSNGGRTWSQLGSQVNIWGSIACSANGKIIYISPTGAGTVQKSIDGGETWAASVAANGTLGCSADGSQVFTGNIACSGDGTYQARLTAGVISVSTNSAGSFFNTTVPAANVICLAASSDCTRLVAGVTNGLLYASANQGATWSAITTTNQAWSGAWMSADGSRFAGTVRDNGGISGGVYYYGVNAQPNTVNTNSTISGSQGSAVELQYIGGNKFMPVSSTGLIWAN